MDDELTQDTITFGKYKGSSLDKLLRDRNYCKWLSKQSWFQEQYEYLFNRIQEHNPIQFFVNVPPSKEFYPYFHLLPIEEVKTTLTNDERACYEYYLSIIDKLRQKIAQNGYDIKAPSSWLKKFEKEYSISREVFKEFLSAHDLPNIPSIVEDIKAKGNIEYKGARSYIIAKKKSVKQEKYWEKLLKKKYGEDIGSQFRLENCVFDFIHIPSSTLYECKLGIKDFSYEQYKKYSSILKTYRIVYLIGYDTIISLNKSKIYTTRENLELENRNRLERKLREYEMIRVEGMKNLEKYI